jgi:phosphatidylserine decarboxylase
LTSRSVIARLVQQEDINFLLTNRIPRGLLTRLVGRLSRIESPWFCKVCIAIWRLFTDLDLNDAKKSRFNSVHECFTRELKEGARRIDTDPGCLVSPCDALLGAHGRIARGMALQAKGFDYPLLDLLRDEAACRYYEGGLYATLRLTSSMYHRFHAPADCRVEQVLYISGDTWNVNPIALKRVERLFCKNERAVLRCRLDSPGGAASPDAATAAVLTLVPVAAILVASIRLKFLDVLLHLKYRGPHLIPCNASLRRGEEMGWFEHGSTIIVLAPPGTVLAPGIGEGTRLAMGQAIMRIT